jgi:hypothetical protein
MKPNIMGKENTNEKSRSEDALPVKIIWEIVEKIKADRPVTGARCHGPG